MAPPSSPLDASTRRRLARVLVEEAGWGPEAASAALGTAEEAVCAVVQGLFAPAITPRLLPAVDNRVTVLLGSGANAGGRCVARLLFGVDEGDGRPIFPRLSHAFKTKLLDLLARALRANLHSVVRFCQACPCPPPPPSRAAGHARHQRRPAAKHRSISPPLTGPSRKRGRSEIGRGSTGDGGGGSLLRRLLDLFLLVEGGDGNEEEEERVLEVGRMVLRLIGIVGTAGVEAKDLKRLLRLLRMPPQEGEEEERDGEEERQRRRERRRRRRLRLVAPILEAIRTLVGRPEDDDSPGPRPPINRPTSKAQPASFFSLGGGPHSGLIVPRIPAWPFPQSYHFLGWFRIERFPPTRRERARAQEEASLVARGLSGAAGGGSSSSVCASPPVFGRGSSTSSGGSGGSGGGISEGGSGGHRRLLHADEQRAHLFAFLTEDGHGVDVFLADDTLWVEVRDSSRSRGGSEVVETLPIEGVALRTRTWYFLDVQHTRSRVPVFLGKGDALTVQIDHQQVFKGHVRFPKDVSGPLARCSIGEGFDGQLAPVYVLREPVAPPIALQLARAASPAPVPHRNANAAIDLEPQAHLPGVSSRKAFESKVLLVYHPERCRSQMCLDLHGGLHGRIVVDGGASNGVWGLDHASDVLASIGGVAVLFPLFFLLLVAPSAPPPGREEGKRQEEAKGPVLSLLLSILARALRAHETNQQEFYRINGVAMLEHAIRRIPARRLPAAASSKAEKGQANDKIQRCVGTLMDLCAAAQGHPQLESAMVRRLLSPALWAHATLAFQVELQRQVSGFVRRQPALARQALSVSSLLDAIRDHFLPQQGPSRRQQLLLQQDDEEDEDGGPLPGWEGNPSLMRMFRHHGFSRPRLGVVQAAAAGALSSSSGGNGGKVHGLSSTGSPVTAIVEEEGEGEEERDRGVLRRTILHTVMGLCQEEVTPQELRPMSQFLAAFGPGGKAEAVAAEEVLQVLLFWLLQDPPTAPRGLLESVRHLFGTPQAFVAFIILAAVNRGGAVPDALRATGLRVLVAYLMRLDSAPPPSSSSSILPSSSGSNDGGGGPHSAGASVALVPASPTLTASSTAASVSMSSATSSPVLGAWDDGAGAGGGGAGRMGSASTSKLALPSARTASLSSRSARTLSSSSAAARISTALSIGGSNSNAATAGASSSPSGYYAFAASTGPIDRQLLHPQHGGGGAVVGFLLHYLLQHAAAAEEGTYAALLEAVLATRATLGSLPMFSRPTLTGACLVPSRLQPTRVMDDADELRNVMALTVLLKLLPALAAPLKERAFGDLLLLLKYSERNRMAFVTVAGWQVPLFEMMAPYILPWDAAEEEPSAPLPYQQLQQQRPQSASPFPSAPSALADIFYDPALPPFTYNLLRTRAPPLRRGAADLMAARGEEEEEEEEEDDDDDDEDDEQAAQEQRQRRREGVLTDHWVDMGLRVYVLLLFQVLQREGGWQEVARALSLASTTATHAHHAPDHREAGAGVSGQSAAASTSPGQLLLFAVLVQLLGEVHGDIKTRIARLREQEAADPSSCTTAGGGETVSAAMLPPVYRHNLIQVLFLVDAFLLDDDEGEEVVDGAGKEEGGRARASPVTLSVLGLSLEDGEEGGGGAEEGSSSSGNGSVAGGSQQPPSGPALTSSRRGHGMVTGVEAAGSGGGDGEWRRFCKGGGQTWLRSYPPFAPSLPSTTSSSTFPQSPPPAAPSHHADAPSSFHGTGVKGRRVCAATAGRTIVVELLQVLDALWMLTSLSSAASDAAAAAANNNNNGASGGRRRGSSEASSTLGVSLGSTSSSRAGSPLGGSLSPRGMMAAAATVAMITPQTLEFLAQEGPSLLIGGGSTASGGGRGEASDGGSSGSVALLMLRLSLFVLDTAHPAHPYATVNVYRLKRLNRVLSLLLGQSSSKTGPVGFFAFASAAAAQAAAQAVLLGDWLLLLLAHTQNALRRYRALLEGTVARPPTRDSDDPACPFCGGGPLEAVVRQVEDLLDVLEACHRDHGPLLQDAMPPQAWAHFAQMLQARAAYYASHRRRRRLSSSNGVGGGVEESWVVGAGREEEQAAQQQPAFARCSTCFPGEEQYKGSEASLPWRTVWLQSPWFDSAAISSSLTTDGSAVLLGATPAVRKAARHLLGREAAWCERVRYYRAFCLEQQWVEERLWRVVDPRAAMFLEGRALRAQLEEAEHQRLASRAAARDVGERRAIAGWAAVMRAHSAEWSAWAVEDEKSRWKISSHSDAYRRRMLLTRTDKFDDHQGAAYQSGAMAPDRLPSSVGGAQEQESAEEERQARRLLAAKRRRGTEEAGGVGGNDEGGEEGAAAEQASSVSSTSAAASSPSKRRTTLSESVAPPSASSMKLPSAEELGAGEAWVTTQVAIVVNPYGSMQGRVLLTTQGLYFHPDRHLLPLPAKGEDGDGGGEKEGEGEAAGGGERGEGRGKKKGKGKEGFAYQWKDKKWRLDRVTEVHGRRFLLRNCALEVYFSDAHEVFLAFPTPKDRATFFAKLSRQHMPLLATPKLLRPAEILRESGFTELWRRRQVSNFEYLMRLNIIAGRSYNDVNQYPVFPWVLADYDSPTLDLSDPKTFRDLSKPVGALDADRLRFFLERYQSLEEVDDGHIPPFMYGSHYSSAALVLHYLLRQEPFATLAVKLQSGAFDCPDRLFFSLAAAWRGCHRSPTDVKELVPELFAVPEVLLNTNRYPLGQLEEGKGLVDDVRLPPWAKDAHDFVRLNRLALESEHVSRHLHHWIDLVFGHKQRGPASVEARNVFYYLTYEGAVDIDAIDDAVLREATEAQIKHYGQTPSQLLAKPHPPRLPPEECVRPLCADVASLPNLRAYTPDQQLLGLPPSDDDGSSAAISSTAAGGIIAAAASAAPVLSVAVLPGSGGGRLLVVSADLLVATYRWSAMPDAHDFPFTVRPERVRQLPCQASSMSSYAIFDSAACASHLSHHHLTREGDEVARGFVDVRREGAGGREDSPLLRSMGDLGLDEGEEDEEQEEEDSILGGDAAGGSMGPWNFALAAGGHLICCGFWDHAVKCYALQDGLRPLQTGGNGGHRGAVNCVQVGEDGRTLVTAGQDGTCRVWVVADQGDIAAALRSDSAYLAPASGATAAAAGGGGGNGLSMAGAAGTGAASAGGGSAGSPLLGRRPSGGVAAAVGSSSGGGGAEAAAGTKAVGLAAELSSDAVMGGGDAGSSNGGGGTGAGGMSGDDGQQGPIMGSSQPGHAAGPYIATAFSSSAPTATAGSSASSSSSGGPQAPLQCVAILWGHDTPVVALSLSTQLDLLASGSADGAIVLHRVRKGKYVRRVPYPGHHPVHLLHLCAETGNIVAHSWGDRALHAFSINGRPLATVPRLPERLYALACTADGALLLTGGRRGVVGVRQVHSLELLREVRIGNGPIRCLSFTPDHQYLLVGSEDGTFSVVADPLSRLQMLHRVLSRTFFGVI